jgi:hypothetical protein
MLNLREFRASIDTGEPPDGVSAALRGLWSEAAGDWARGHELVQDESDEASAWVHAYLHRKEGNLSNARYWYARASRPASCASHDEEWEQIVSTLLAM